MMTQVMQLDLASLRSVRAFADSWRRRNGPLHVLVNNAGIFSMGGAHLNPKCSPARMLSTDPHFTA